MTKTPKLPDTNQQLDVYKAEYGLSRSQIKMIKDNIARGATDSQLKLFLYQAKSVGLNPLKQQCRLVVRNSSDGPVATFQTTIDGYRAIANRSGVYAGMDDVEYDTETAANPKWAKVTIYKIVQGTKVAFTVKARWSEYLPSNEKQQFMWRKMPFLMLGKVAEALALRKAFPEDLAGIYTDIEMHQASEDTQPPFVDDTAKPSMDTAKSKPEEVPSDFEEVPSEENDSTRMEASEPPPAKELENTGAEPAATRQEPDKSEAGEENSTEATPNPYNMNKAALIAYLAKEKGRRYSTMTFAIIKNDLFGTKTKITSVTKDQLIKILRTLRKGGFE